MQIYSTANSVHSGAKMFNYSVHELRYFFVFYHVLKNCRLRQICMFWVVHANGQWTHYFSMLWQTLIFITVRHE